MTETVENTETGAILYDKAIINQISAEHFAPQGWPHAESLTGPLRSGGRGKTMYVGNVPRQFVLRHYVRGGLIGKLIRDSYLFSGADATRSFMEWRLLDKLAVNNMNVPRPALTLRDVDDSFVDGKDTERKRCLTLTECAIRCVDMQESLGKALIRTLRKDINSGHVPKEPDDGE